MPYCTRCGVEVNDKARKCPLCSSPIQQFFEDPSPGREYPEDPLSSAAPRLNPKERTRVALLMTTFGIMIPLLITLAADITVTRTISWSIYPLIGLVSAWLMVLLALTKSASPYGNISAYMIVWGYFLILCAALGAMYLFSHPSSDLLFLGVPISFFAALLTHGIVSLSSHADRKGGNVAGFILIGTGIFCGLTDLLLSFRLRNTLHMGWSLIVLAAVLPVSAMLLYLHYRKKKKTRLSRFFHT